MYRKRTVAVVIPAHNERRLLPKTLAGIPAFVDAVFVVDDGSEDGTSEVSALSADHRVSLIIHSENRGVGASIVSGYKQALLQRFQMVVVVGADAQMDMSEMHTLLDPLVDGLGDYAKGDRMSHPEVWSRMPLIRLLGNRVLTFMTRFSSGYRDLHDAQCGYTAINHETLGRLPLDELYPRYGFPNDLLAKLGELNATLIERDVTPIYASESSGIRIGRVAFPIFWLILRSGFRRLWRKIRDHSPESSTERPIDDAARTPL